MTLVPRNHFLSEPVERFFEPVEQFFEPVERFSESVERFSEPVELIVDVGLQGFGV